MVAVSAAIVIGDISIALEWNNRIKRNVPAKAAMIHIQRKCCTKKCIWFKSGKLSAVVHRSHLL